MAAVTLTWSINWSTRRMKALYVTTTIVIVTFASKMEGQFVQACFEVDIHLTNPLALAPFATQE